MPFTIEWVHQCAGMQLEQAIATPAGNLLVRSCDDVICQIDWLEMEAFIPFGYRAEPHSIFEKIMMYWYDPMAVVPLRLLRRGTVFQHKVWNELLKIPFGKTSTYKELAARIGSAARPIGGACRSNHYPLVIPCHRVVSVSGMGGYSGQTQGELMSIKLQLLEYEKQ
ncbi:MAG: methylated-DNA--[protein]-cysteine S-methyltransferase [Gammaproteobacteria bacterium]